MDDVLVYCGNLEPSPDRSFFSDKTDSVSSKWRKHNRSRVDESGEVDLSQTVLFTNDAYITQQEVTRILCSCHFQQPSCNKHTILYFFIPQAERVPCCDDGIEFIDEGMVKIQDVESMSKERPMTSHTGKRV